MQPSHSKQQIYINTKNDLKGIQIRPSGRPLPRWGPALIPSKGTWPIPALRQKADLQPATSSDAQSGPALCAILLVPFWDEGGTHYNLAFKVELSPHLSLISSDAMCNMEGFREDDTPDCPMPDGAEWEGTERGQCHPTHSMGQPGTGPDVARSTI